MIVTFAHLCDYAIVSQDGKLSVLGIFDKVNAPVFPWPHPTFHFAFQVESEYDERGTDFTIRVQLVNQDGALLMQGELPIRTIETGAPGQRQHSNQVMAVHGFPFPKADTYEFVIQINGAVVNRLPFEVLHAKPPE